MNAVMQNKPKMLIGLSQKAMWWAQGLKFPLSWALNTTGEKRGPTSSIRSIVRNTVSP